MTDKNKQKQQTLRKHQVVGRDVERGISKTEDRAAKADNTDPLTEKEMLFIREYLFPSDGSQAFSAKGAAIRAGYSKRSAHTYGHRIFNKVSAHRYMATLQAPKMAQFDVTADRIMQEICALAFSNVMDYITFDDQGQAYVDLAKCTREQASALAGVDITDLPPVPMEDGEEPGFQAGRVQLRTRIKLWDKLSALDALMRRYNLIKPLEVNHTVSGSLTLDTTERARKVAFMLRKAAEEKRRSAVVDVSPEPDDGEDGEES